jgi:hypothetical protein
MSRTRTTTRTRTINRKTCIAAALAVAAATSGIAAAQTAGTNTTRPGAPGATVTPHANPSGGNPVQNVPLGSSQEPASGSAQPHSGSMRSADDANTIRHVQSQLKSAGHDPGPIDGSMSQSTTSALRSFQQQRGLPATGQLDPQTLSALGIQDTAGGGGRLNPADAEHQPTPHGRQDSTSSRTGGAATEPSPGTSGATGSNMSGTTDTNSATRR